jgi:SAM-dependent methyltransferase
MNEHAAPMNRRSKNSASSVWPPFRADHEETRRWLKDSRSSERVRAHYVLERILANRLRNARSAVRSRVYCEVYEELFRSLPDHPQRAVTKPVRERRVQQLLMLLMPLLGPQKTLLEIGCGDAELSSAVAPKVKRSYALDVTAALIEGKTLPENLEFVLTSGTEIGLPDASIDVALSDQLMEHLHPDDAFNQLLEVFRVLKPGGVYLCLTPNRLTGPHDISVRFDYEATGFHLQEYDSRSLSSLLRMAGFRRVNFVALIGVHKLPVPHLILRCLEATLRIAPNRIRAWCARCLPVVLLAGLNVLAKK